jgi:signal transduction histidine kinase
VIGHATRKLGRALDMTPLEPHVHAFPVQDLLNEVANEWWLAAQEKRLIFRVHKCSLFIESDRDMLATIINNFVANAIRYTDRGRIIVGCRRHGDHVLVAVYDTGIGIPPDMIEQIFEEFRQVAPQSRQGFGLGLAIVRHTAQALRHRIVVQSQLRCGSYFGVEVPIARAPQASTMATARVISAEKY